MTIVRHYQPALFPSPGDDLGEIRIDLNIHLDGRGGVVHLGQRISTFPGDTQLSLGGVSARLDPCDPSDAMAAVETIIRAALAILTPF